MKITAKKIIEINRSLGGSLRSDSSLAFAESICQNHKSKYKRASFWLRAIIVDHPFTDANKRTALFVLWKLRMKNGEKMEDLVAKIAVNNIDDIQKIEEMIHNANRRN